MKRVLVIGVMLLLTACAGTRFDWDQARKIRVGTTEAELIGLLGKPYLVRTQGNTQTWVWSYADGIIGKTGMVSFPMKDGRVTEVPNMPF